MEALSQILPIIVYILLIVVIIIGIILGIKLIITIDKVNKVVDDVDDKVKKVTPLFDAIGIVSDKANSIVTSVVGVIESFIEKIFFKESEKDEDE